MYKIENGEINKMACTFLDVDSDSSKVPLMSSPDLKRDMEEFFSSWLGLKGLVLCSLKETLSRC